MNAVEGAVPLPIAHPTAHRPRAVSSSVPSGQRRTLMSGNESSRPNGTSCQSILPSSRAQDACAPRALANGDGLAAVRAGKRSIGSLSSEPPVMNGAVDARCRRRGSTRRHSSLAVGTERADRSLPSPYRRQPVAVGQRPRRTGVSGPRRGQDRLARGPSGWGRFVSGHQRPSLATRDRGRDSSRPMRSWMGDRERHRTFYGVHRRRLQLPVVPCPLLRGSLGRFGRGVSTMVGGAARETYRYAACWGRQACPSSLLLTSPKCSSTA